MNGSGLMTEQWAEKLAGDLTELKVLHAEIRTQVLLGFEAVTRRLDAINGSVGRHDGQINDHANWHAKEASYAAGKAQAVITKSQLAAITAAVGTGVSIAGAIAGLIMKVLL